MKNSTFYSNPVLFADYSDPDVIRVEDNYFCVASSFTYLPGIPVLQSKDLVNWNLINYCVKELPFDKYNQPVHGSGTWAPSIRYYNNKFYVFIPLPDEGIYVVETENPYEEWSKMHCLKKVQGWIDPCPFWDDDGKTYMVFAYAYSRSGIKHKLSICEITADAKQILTDPVLIFDGTITNPTLEGPKLYKKDGFYYIFAPAGGVENGWQTVLRSKNIYGPYEYRIVMHQGNTNINGPHQGGYVEDIDGNGFFMHFQDKGPYGRICHLQPVDWNNGWPFIGQEQNGDGIGEPVDKWKIPAHSEEKFGGGIPKSDEFTSEELGKQWQWQANPSSNWYSLIEKPGHMRLYTLRNEKRDENLLWYAPNLCTQIIQSPSFEVVTSIELQGDKTGDICGIGLTGHQYSYFGIAYKNHKYHLELWSGKVIEPQGLGLATEELFYTKTVELNKVLLKIELYEDAKYKYAFSVDGKTFLYVDEEFKLEKGTWTGAKFALVALNKNNKKSQGFGDFEYIRFSERL